VQNFELVAIDGSFYLETQREPPPAPKRRVGGEAPWPPPGST
jgi:hypothetical protein